MKEDIKPNIAEKVTDLQWFLIDEAIKSFIKEWPQQWIIFQNQLKIERTDFNEAKEGKLKSNRFRATGAFPVIYNPDGTERANVLEMIKKIIPGFAHTRSKAYPEFMRRYPMFRPSRKTNC